MWHPDNAIHEAHVTLILEVASIADATKRHLHCLKLIEGYSAMSALSADRFRSWVCVMSQAAQDPTTILPESIE